MGHTGVADNSDPSTIYFNPANAVGGSRAYGIASKMEWPDDWFADDLWMGRAQAGYAWRGSGDGALSWGADFTLGKFSYGESMATLPDGTPLGTFESWEKVASLAIGVGIPLGDRYEVRVGAAGKRWWAQYAPAGFTQDIVVESFDAYALDAGVTGVLNATVGDWTVNPALAVAMIDAGPDIEAFEGDTDPLPRRVNFGAGVYVESPARRVWNADVPILTVSVNVDGTDQRYGDFEWGIGTEVAVGQILFLRTGAHMTEESGDDVTQSGWGVGVGLPVSSLRLRFDYTESDFYQGITTTHMGVTASWLF
jgi:hypothetical protein